MEALLTAGPGSGRFVPLAGGGRRLPESAAGLPTRTASAKNPTYSPLTAGALGEYDWLAMVDATGYQRGGPALREWTGGEE